MLNTLVIPNNKLMTEDVVLQWTLSPEMKEILRAERRTLDEVRLGVFYNIQMILVWVLDYQLNSNTKTIYAKFLSDSMNRESWVTHFSYVLDFLLSSSEVITRDFKDNKK